MRTDLDICSLFRVAFLAAALSSTAAVRAAPAKPVAAATEIEKTEYFEVRSNIRSNLYHLLLNWAWFDLKDAPPWAQRIGEREDDFKKLSPEDQARWQAAVTAIASRVQGRNENDDVGMIAVRDAAAGALKNEQVPAADRPTIEAVDGVLDLYARVWWPDHQKKNRAWIDALLPTLRKVEKGMTRRLAAAYGGTWPTQRVPIDVVVYAVPLGAYSSTGRVTMSSTKKGYEMPFAVEMVLHESSHLAELEPPLEAAIESAFKAAKREPPQKLWHDFIFYTSGEVARMGYAEISPKDAAPYRHYGEMAGGVYRRNKELWDPMLPVLARTWAPFVASGSGKANERAAALQAFVRDLPPSLDGH